MVTHVESENKGKTEHETSSETVGRVSEAPVRTVVNNEVPITPVPVQEVVYPPAQIVTGPSAPPQQQAAPPIIQVQRPAAPPAPERPSLLPSAGDAMNNPLTALVAGLGLVAAGVGLRLRRRARGTSPEEKPDVDA